MKIESMRKRYETAQKAVEQVNRMEDLHQSAGVDLEDTLIDFGELIEWVERAAPILDKVYNGCCQRITDNDLQAAKKLLAELTDAGEG